MEHSKPEVIDEIDEIEEHYGEEQQLLPKYDDDTLESAVTRVDLVL